MMEKVTITEIDRADPDDSTAITHGVTLSDGREISVWAGKPCYTKPDEYRGHLEVGATLLKEEPDYGYSVFYFDKE